MSFSIHIDALTYDFRIQNGKLVLVRGSETIRERLRVIIQRYKGEWFLNTSKGIEYYSEDNKILGQTTNIDEVSAIIRGEILSEPGVIRIQKFSISQSSRDVSISADVKVERTEWDDQTNANGVITVTV